MGGLTVYIFFYWQSSWKWNYHLLLIFQESKFFFSYKTIVGWIRVAHLFLCFVLSYYVSLRSEFRVVMFVTISALKRSIFSSYSPPVVCRRAHVVFTLFVFVCVYWSPTHIDCVVFLLCFSSPCVLCTLCCQFLWIVHFWLPLRYSLTFIETVIYVICQFNINKY